MTTDSEVIRRSRDSPGAFGDLFHRHAAVLHRYLTRRAGRDVAEEVTAETFLVAFEQRARYDHDRADARPWLFGIATNLLNAHRRREARHLRAMARAAEPEGGDGGLGRVVDRVDASSDLRLIAEALRALTPGDRDVLLLHAWGDLTTEQIAAALRIPGGTVRSRLFRARKSLRESARGTAHEENDHGRAGAAATA